MNTAQLSSSSRPLRQRIIGLVAVVSVLVVGASATASAQNAEIEQRRAEREALRQDKLNLARQYEPVWASIDELQESVAVLNANRTEQELELELLRQQQASAQAYAAQLDEDIAELQLQVEQAQDNVVQQAVLEYVRPSDFEQIMESNDFNITEKRETLLASVNGTELDTIEGFRQAQANLGDLIDESERAVAGVAEAQEAVEAQIVSVDESIAELQDAQDLLELKLEDFFREQRELETAEAETIALLNGALAEEAQRQALIEQQRIAEERAALARQQEAALAAARARAAASGTSDTDLTDEAHAAFAELVQPSQPAPPFNGSMSNPVPGSPVTSGWGMRVNPVSGVYKMHEGVDFGAGSGTPIQAAATGKVIAAGNAGDGYGNKVVLDHGGGTATLYAHQSSIAVSVGQTVGQGEVLGYVGSTGNSTGAHLHFEVRVNGTSYDPMGYL